MADSDFLVTLPSNSNMDTHPSNEPANYTVKLSEPLNLEGDWEAALVSLQYTPNWLSFDTPIRFFVAYSSTNVPKYHYPQMYTASVPVSFRIVSPGLLEILKQIANDISIQEIETAVNRAFPSSKIKLRAITVPPKYYSSAEALGREVCNAIKTALSDEVVEVSYLYDARVQLGEFIISTGEILLVSDDSTRTSIISEVLGIGSAPIECKCKLHNFAALATYGSTPPKLRMVHSLWVYSNITQYQQVGDAKVPLLGIVPAQNNHTDRVHYTFNPVHFQALNRNHISEISIQIVDDRGNRIPFIKSRYENNLVCCLRFRRRKSLKPI
jgi:hypothetical protein